MVRALQPGRGMSRAHGIITVAASLVLVIASASADTPRWHLVTSVDYAASFHPSGPTAHVPAFGLSGGVRLPRGFVIELVTRAPLVVVQAHGRFDAGGAVGWLLDVPRSSSGARFGVRAEGGYTWAFSDIQEGYLRGPSAVDYAGPYTRGSVELGLRMPALPGAWLSEVSAALVVGGTGVFTSDGVRSGFDVGLAAGLHF